MKVTFELFQSEDKWVNPELDVFYFEHEETPGKFLYCNKVVGCETCKLIKEVKAWNLIVQKDKRN